MPNLSDLQSSTQVLAALILAMVVITIFGGLLAADRRRRRTTASLTAIDFVRTTFASRLARGDPIDKLLVEVVEGLVDSLKLDAAEIWLHQASGLRRQAAHPPREQVEIVVTQAEDSIVANATISGPAWARVWLPGLLEGRQAAPLRFAPISASGQLLGLIVVERRLRGDQLGRDADPTLEELARELGAGLHRQQLDAALHASLDQLRQQADELQASRARIVAAADAERRRIERDLHDGAQQYLVAIAVKVRLMEQLARTDPERELALTEELMADVELALEELRTLAHGIYPPQLTSGGLRQALAAACRRAAIPTTLEAAGVGRHAPELEAAFYYCCLEALQNAAKHAGEGASATVRVWDDGGEVRFEVSDDGTGFDPTRVSAGVGLANMGDRLGAVGGTLTVESAAGAGTRVAGTAPIAAHPSGDGPSSS